MNDDIKKINLQTFGYEPVEIDGLKFGIKLFSFKEAFRLNFEIMAIFSPVLDLLGSIKKGINQTKEEKNEKKTDDVSLKDFMDGSFSLSGLGDIVKNVLMSLNDPYEFVKTITKNSVWVRQNPNGELLVELNTDEGLDECFKCKISTAFKLCFKIMQVNKLAFTDGLGGLANLTDIFKRIPKEKMNEVKK